MATQESGVFSSSAQRGHSFRAGDRRAGRNAIEDGGRPISVATIEGGVPDVLRLLSASLVVIALAGCGNAPTVSPSTAGSPRATATSSPAIATADATASAASAASVTPTPVPVVTATPPVVTPATAPPPTASSPSGSPRLTRGPVPPGTLRIDLFEPAFEITVPAGFILRELSPTYVFMSMGVTRQSPALFVARLPRPGTVDLVDRAPAYISGDPFDIAIGGVSGRAIDIEPGPGQDFLVPIGGGEVLWPGMKGRLIELEVGGAPLVILLTAPVAQFDAQLALYEPMLASVSFAS